MADTESVGQLVNNNRDYFKTLFLAHIKHFGLDHQMQSRANLLNKLSSYISSNYHMNTNCFDSVLMVTLAHADIIFKGNHECPGWLH